MCYVEAFSPLFFMFKGKMMDESEKRVHRISIALIVTTILALVVSLASLILIGFVIQDYLKWNYSTEETEATFQAKINHYQSLIDSYESQSSNLAESIKDSNSKLVSMNAEIDGLVNTRDELLAVEAEFNKIKEENESLSASVASLQLEKKSLELSLSDINNQITRSQTNQKELNTNIQSLTAERDSLNKTVTELNGKTTQLKSDVSSMQSYKEEYAKTLVNT